MSIKIRFLGATRNVTGSRFLVEADDTRVLVDCGLYQEREFRDRNWDPFVIPPDSIDAVILTHGHLDHCGLLPKLAKEGFTGPIFCSEATSEIAPVVLADSAYLQEEDARFKAKRLKKENRQPKFPIRPLYTAEDVDAMLPQLTPVEFREEIKIADGIQAEFHEAGHILGSSTVKLTAQNGGEPRSIVFSGDIGRWNRPILNDPDPFTSADYVLMESTYGDRDHPQKDEIQNQLAEVINDTHKRGGNIVIPAFAIERSQEILYRLNLLFRDHQIPEIPVFLDSPMAIKVTEIFKKHQELYDDEMCALLLEDKTSPFSFRGLKFVTSRMQSKAINNIRGTAIIIAGSGMCTGGRIKHHLVHNISRPQSTLLFVGYQANGTLGRQIVEGRNPVRILGHNHDVKALIHQIHGFSGHADRLEMLRWVKSFEEPPKTIFMIHGGANVSQHFAEFVSKETGWKTVVPSYQDLVELD